MKPFCSTRVHFQGNVCTRLCLLQLQQCSTTFSQAINLNVELHSTGCLSQPFFWCYLQSKRSKTLSVVRGSPRLLAYQPVIYVKILAKRESEGKKKGKASEESVLAERWHKEAVQQIPHATSAWVHDPRKGLCFSAPMFFGSAGLLPQNLQPSTLLCHEAPLPRSRTSRAARDLCQQRSQAEKHPWLARGASPRAQQDRKRQHRIRALRDIEFPRPPQAPRPSWMSHTKINPSPRPSCL